DVKGKTFLVGHRTVSVGRAPGNTIQVSDPAASRNHCQIRGGNGFIDVIDMHSKNATLINGEPSETGRMVPGDQLSVGQARFLCMKELDTAHDDALGQKKGGPDAAKSTLQGGASSEIVDIVKVALRENDGDIDRAATKLGIPPDSLRRIVRDIDPQEL